LVLLDEIRIKIEKQLLSDYFNKEANIFYVKRKLTLMGDGKVTNGSHSKWGYSIHW
jgi:hypothetical protein